MAAELDLTRDTLNGLVAFVTPGDDPYSVAQGVATTGPGGIAAGATDAMIETLDRVVPDIAFGRLAGMFEAAGWQVLTVKYGRRLEALFERAGYDELGRSGGFSASLRSGKALSGGGLRA